MSVAVQQAIQVGLDYFVAHEYPKVVAAVGLITGNRQDAADAVQDALVGFLAKPPRHHPVSNVSAWITVVASNRMRDQYRRGTPNSARLRRSASIRMPFSLVGLSCRSEMRDSGGRR